MPLMLKIILASIVVFLGLLVIYQCYQVNKSAKELERTARNLLKDGEKLEKALSVCLGDIKSEDKING